MPHVNDPQEVVHTFQIPIRDQLDVHLQAFRWGWRVTVWRSCSGRPVAIGNMARTGRWFRLKYLGAPYRLCSSGPYMVDGEELIRREVPKILIGSGLLVGRTEEDDGSGAEEEDREGLRD